MEVMVGISLYSYLYFKLAKMLPYYLMLFLQHNLRRRGQSRFCQKGEGRGEVAQTMYTHVKMIKQKEKRKYKSVI
jgi:hypothetical protein